MTTCENRADAMEPEPQAPDTEGLVVRRDGVLHSVLRGLFWPFGLVVRVYRGVWWALGFRQQEATPVVPPVSTPGRQSLAGRKRLNTVTRLLLNVLPRWMHGALGFPQSSSIGRCLSPEIRVSPTKPCGKGSKRKQDEIEEDDEEEEEQQTWVEALNQEMSDNEDPEDLDYEPSSVETESEEYCSHNNTESDIEIHGKNVVIIEDVKTVR